MGRATTPIHITVIGYYGFANTGDEALLQSLLTGLKRDLPEADICVLSADPEQTARHHQVRSINRWDVRQVLRQLKRSQLLISGGGTLLQDSTSVRSLMYYAGIILAARRFGCAVFLYANGIGPVQTRIGRWFTRRAIRAAHAITLRDYRSLELLERICTATDLNRHTKLVEVTADPAFHLQPPAPEAGKKLLATLGIPSDKPLLGVSLRPAKHLHNALPVLGAAVNRLAAEFDVHCVLLPLQSPADLKVSRQIEPLLTVPYTLLPGNLTPQDILTVLQQMDAVVGMRLHALILAAAGRVPVAGIEYDPKVASFLVEVGQLNLGPLAGLQEEQVVRELRRFWRERPRAKEILEERIPLLEQRAKRNDEIALQLVRRFQESTSR